jgi:hypothetical protein
MKFFSQIPVHKTILAKLFAKENVSVVHKKGISTAMFDPKSRTVFLPYWQDVSLEMYDFLCAHETGHARFTPLDGFHKSDGNLFKGKMRSYINIIEDIRIEKLQLRSYPGLKDAFVSSYSEMKKRDFFKLSKLGPLKETYLGNRLNLYFKLGRWDLLDVPFLNKTEQNFLERATLLESFEEVRQLAIEIYEYDKKMFKDKQMMKNDHYQQNSAEEGEKQEEDSGHGNEDEDEDDKETSSSKKKKKKGDSKDKKDQKKGNKKDKKSADKTDGEDGESSSDDDESDQEGEEGDGEDEGDGEGEDGEADGEGDGEGEDGEADGEGDGDSSEDGEGEGEGKGDGSAKEEKKSKAGKNPQQQGAGRGVSHNTSAEDFEHDDRVNSTDDAFQSAMEELANGSINLYEEVLFVNLPKVDSSKFIISDVDVLENFKKCAFGSKTTNLKTRTADFDDTTGRIYASFKKKHAASVNFLIKEFEMRKAADEHQRTMSTKMGDLDLKKLHQYKFTEDIFRRADTVSEGKSHGLVMLLDMSGSMRSIFYKTMEQLLILSEFCYRSKIPFEVYGFSDQGAARGKLSSSRLLKAQAGDVAMPEIDSMSLIKLIHGNMSLNQYRVQVGALLSYAHGISGHNAGEEDTNLLTDLNNANYNLQNTSMMILCGTPLIGAMYLMEDVISKFKEKTKSQIVHFFNLTDGAGGNINNYYTDSSAYRLDSIYDTNSTAKIKSRLKVVYNDVKTRKQYEYNFVGDQLVGQAYDAYNISMNLLSRRIEALGCNVININLLTSSTSAGEIERGLNANQYFEKCSKNGVQRKEIQDISDVVNKHGFAKIKSSLYTYEFFMNARIPASKFDIKFVHVEYNNSQEIANQVVAQMNLTMNTRLLAVEFSKLIAK